MTSKYAEDYSFRGNAALPLSDSELRTILRPPFRTIDTHSLVSLIWSRFNVKKFSRVTSTLVNVYSPFSNFSRGCEVEPPKEASPPGSHIIFTFYLIAVPNTKLIVTKLSTQVFSWEKEGKSYISIGINSAEAARLGIILANVGTIRYLYNVLGSIFRTIIMNYSQSELTSLANGNFSTPEGNLYQYASEYYNLPLSAIVRRPFWTWAFNKDIWHLAPNLIPYKTLSSFLAFYYFIFISKDLSKLCSQDDGLARVLGTADCETGIAKVVTKSTMLYVQYLNNPSDYQFELIDLLVPNLLANLLYLGHTNLSYSSDSYLLDMKQNLVSLSELFKDKKVIQNLMPFEDTTRAIIFNEDSFITSLVRSLNDI